MVKSSVTVVKPVVCGISVHLSSLQEVMVITVVCFSVSVDNGQ